VVSVLNSISSILRNLDGLELDVFQIKDKPELYSEINFSGTRFFLSPLSDAISAPMTVRRFHLNQSEVGHLNKCKNLIEDVMRSAYNLFIVLKGEEGANIWQMNALKESQKILAAKGPIGMFEKNNGFSWIVSAIEDGNEYQHLVFRQGRNSETPLRLATRDNYAHKLDHGEDFLGYDGFIPIEQKYALLVKSLQSFKQSWQHFSQRTHHHLYCWSNDAIESFQKSFVQSTLRKYKQIISNESMYSSYGLIICRISNTNELFGLKKIEQIALQRIRPGSILYIANGENKVKIQQISEFVSSIGIDDEYLYNTKRELSYHQCQVGEIESTAIAAIIPLWAGLWKDSREIDGEQIIALNDL
jgi:hypothetical protein